MLLTISTTHRPATDLGYLLHKNPARLQTFTTTFGAAHVFYPEASEERCTAALLLEVDPVGLVRGRGKGGGRGAAQAEQYVNDRPYVSSSFTSVAIAEVFGTAMNGRSKERPELAARPIPLEATVACCRHEAARSCCAGSSSRWVTRSRHAASPSTSSSPSGARAATSRCSSRPRADSPTCSATSTC